MAQNWKCQLCIFVTALLASLISHMIDEHSSDSNVRINCCVGNCPESYTRVGSFSRHVRRKHSQYLEPEQSNSHQFSDNADSFDSASNEGTLHQQQYNQNEELAVNTIHCEDQQGVVYTPPHDDSKAAAFILHLQTECRLTQKSTRKVITGIQAFRGNTEKTLKRKLHQALSDKGHGFSHKGIDDIFHENADPFDNFQTEYSVMKYITKKFNYVEPVKVVLGERTVVTRCGQKRKMVQKEDAFYYIPVIKTIEQLMGNPKYREELFRKHTSNTKIMEDYCNGTHYRNHLFYEKHPEALQVMLYLDDVELCNQLGSKAKKHKVGLFYFTVGNIHPRFRSQICAIQLLAVCLSQHLTKERYGIDAVLKPFVDEMLQLEKGVIVNVEGNHQTIYGAVVAVIADTLAAHGLCGLKEGGGFAYRKCRHCMVSADDISSSFKSEDFTRRTPKGHEAMCDELENSETNELREIYSTAFGVNRRSILTNLPYFSVIDNVPQDLMDIILEGCLPYTIKQLLKHYVQEKKAFTVSQLNEKIMNFNYGYIDIANRPTVLTGNVLDDEGVIRQSSSQMWVLGRFLPLFISQYIDLSGTVWQCYLLLLQIMGICFSTMIQKEDITTLKETVEYHLFLFKECFNVNIIPKQHYLCHLSEQIEKFGPLIRLWCMRYEAKHSYFKSLTSSASFKNIAYYMAKRHQLTVTNHLTDIHGQGKPHPSFQDTVIFGPSHHVDDQTYAVEEMHRCNIETCAETVVYESNWVEVHGKVFKPGCFVVWVFEGGMPIFAQTKSIWSVNKIPLLRAVMFNTICFREDLNIFEIQQPLVACAQETICVSTLKVPDVFNGYNTDGEDNLFIVPKSDIRMFVEYE